VAYILIKHYVMPLIPHANGRLARVSQLLIQLVAQIKQLCYVLSQVRLVNVQEILILLQQRHNLA
jgi:hypothetical protein